MFFHTRKTESDSGALFAAISANNNEPSDKGYNLITNNWENFTTGCMYYRYIVWILSLNNVTLLVVFLVCGLQPYHEHTCRNGLGTLTNQRVL